MLHSRPCTLNCLVASTSFLRLTTARKRPLLSPIRLRRGPTENTSRGLYPLLCDITAHAEVCLPSRYQNGLHNPAVPSLARVLPKTAISVTQPFSHGEIRHNITHFLFRGVGWDWVLLVRRPLIGLLYQPRMIDEYGAFDGMKIGRGNRSTRRKPAPLSLFSPQIPYYLTWDRTRAAAVGNWRLTSWSMAQYAF
jgi:hypothetical protein